RTGVVEVERERDDLAFAHQARRGDDVLGPRVVERADLVLRAPSSPVLVLLGGFAQVLAGKLAAHVRTSKFEAHSLSGGRARSGGGAWLVSHIEHGSEPRGAPHRE